MRDTSIHRITMSAALTAAGTTAVVYQPLESPIGLPGCVAAIAGVIYLGIEARILIHRVRVNRRARSYKDDTLRYAGRFTAAISNDKALKRNSRSLMKFLKDSYTVADVDRWAAAMELQDEADFKHRAGTYNKPQRFIDDAADRYWDVDVTADGGVVR
jgi:hypothetical protein